MFKKFGVPEALVCGTTLFAISAMPDLLGLLPEPPTVIANQRLAGQAIKAALTLDFSKAGRDLSRIDTCDDAGGPSISWHLIHDVEGYSCSLTKKPAQPPSGKKPGLS